MPGISTEYLAEQLEATNERIAKGIEDLNRKVDEGQKEFMAFRLDLTDKLSAIRNSLGWAKGIAVAVIVPAVLAIAAFSDIAVDRAARLEESIIALKDHAREQDDRIAKLIELQQESGGRIPQQAPGHTPTDSPTPPAPQ